MSYPKVLSLLLVCEILSVIRMVCHFVRIEVETPIEEICGFAAGQLDLGLATRSHVPMAIEGGTESGSGWLACPHRTSPLPASREI